jgi:hypothetical protein
VPEASCLREQVKNYGWARCTQVLFLCKAELGFLHFVEIVTGWLVTSTQKNPLAENRFLLAGKGAENTEEKSRQCFMGIKCWNSGFTSIML